MDFVDALAGTEYEQYLDIFGPVLCAKHSLLFAKLYLLGHWKTDDGSAYYLHNKDKLPINTFNRYYSTYKKASATNLITVAEARALAVGARVMVGQGSRTMSVHQGSTPVIPSTGQGTAPEVVSPTYSIGSTSPTSTPHTVPISHSFDSTSASVATSSVDSATLTDVRGVTEQVENLGGVLVERGGAITVHQQPQVYVDSSIVGSSGSSDGDVDGSGICGSLDGTEKGSGVVSPVESSGFVDGVSDGVDDGRGVLDGVNDSRGVSCGVSDGVDDGVLDGVNDSRDVPCGVSDGAHKVSDVSPGRDHDGVKEGSTAVSYTHLTLPTKA